MGRYHRNTALNVPGVMDPEREGAEMYRNKYHNKKVIYEGQTFDSKRELSRWIALTEMANKGEIKNLQRQVNFILLPAQRDENGKVIERQVKYIADFVYVQDGKTVVEDCKGLRTDTYVLKRKLMLHVHGVRIKET